MIIKTNEVIEVNLNDMEVCACVDRGSECNLSALLMRTYMPRARADIGFDAHILGVVSEYAWAKHLGLKYLPEPGVANKHEGDVAGKYQIKATVYRGGQLQVSEDSPDHFPYLLAIVDHQLHTIRFVGWLFGHELKALGKVIPRDPKKNWLRDYYFAVQGELNCMSTLETRMNELEAHG